MSTRRFEVEGISGHSLKSIASAILGDEYANDGQAAIALQEAGYRITDYSVLNLLDDPEAFDEEA